MSRLFIELYLDEDVDESIAMMLRARGFVVITTREVGQKGKSDEEQLEYAASHQLALLTHNRVDFELLAQKYFAEGKNHYGIIIAVRRPVSEIVKRLLIILNNVAADEMKDQIKYI